MRANKTMLGQAGFLVLEYLAALPLILLVMVILFSLIHTACFASNTVQRAADLEYSASCALQAIRSDVLGAKGIKALNGGNCLQIRLEHEEAYYYIANGQLYRHGAVKLPIAEKAEAVSFRMIKPDLVEVNFQAGPGEHSLLVQSAFYVRAEN